MEITIQTYKMTFFEYYKMILEKVSSYPFIFKKELRKALRILSRNDARNLICWIREKSGKIKNKKIKQKLK